MDPQGDDQRQAFEAGDCNVAGAFEAGDHITLACNAAGIPYHHHAIVISVSVGNEDADADEGEYSLCVADFSADGIGSVGVSSGLLMSSGNIGLRDRSNTPLSSPEAEAEESPYKSRHGLRVICVSSTNWSKITYASNAPTSPAFTIRRRIEFLLKHPHLIPTYSIIESNCECVAVWCKTGVWTTLQAQSWLGSTNFGSRMAIASLSVASSVVAIPFVGVMLAAGVMTEVASGVWGDRAKKRWEEQTSVLNEAFDQIANGSTTEQRGGKKGEDGKHTNTATMPLVISNPFSDTRSLRGMVDAYQRADALLYMADNHPTAKMMQGTAAAD